MPMTNNGVGLP